jgi:molecular chaperone DnaK (HSP70)
MSRIIEQGAQLPATGRCRSTTVLHNQTSVKFAIHEGQYRVASKNRLLGSFTVSNIPPAEVETHWIVLTLNLDEDGILTATAHLEGDSQIHRLMIERTAHLLSGDRIRSYISEAEQVRPQDDREAEESRRRSRLEAYEKNVRTFVEAENQKAAFRTMIPSWKVASLMEYIHCHMPSQAGRVPEQHEFQLVINKVVRKLGPYCRATRGSIPAWLSNPF